MRISSFDRVVFGLTAVAASSSTFAQIVKPFKINGGGEVTSGLVLPDANGDGYFEHNATGRATLLGKYTTEAGAAVITAFDGQQLVGDFYGSIVFVAANGDKLKFYYQESATPEYDLSGRFYGELGVNDDNEPFLVATFIQEFIPAPQAEGANTGRFAKVSGGSFLMVATSEPILLANLFDPFNYTWQGEGTLEFSRHKEKHESEHDSEHESKKKCDEPTKKKHR